MGDQQNELLRTPVVSRRPLNIDSMISQIDSDARQRREGEKAKRHNSLNSFGKRFDRPPPSLMDEFQYITKRRRVSFDSPTSPLAFDEVSCSTSDFNHLSCQSKTRPKMENNLDFGIRLRPRNLDRDFSRENYSIPNTRDIPFMPF